MPKRSKVAPPPKVPGKRGPKSKYSAAVVAKLAQAVELGASIESACGYAQIGYSTLYEWLAKKTPESAELADAITHARAKGAVALLQHMETAINAGSWQAAARKLEWMFPETYGRRRFEVTGKNGGTVTPPAQVILIPRTARDSDEWWQWVQQDLAAESLDLSKLTDEELAMARALHAKMQADPKS